MKNKFTLIPGGNDFTVINVNKFIAFPFKENYCVAVYIHHVNKENKNCEEFVEVYKPSNFDFMFKNSGTQKIYVNKVLENFYKKKYKLANKTVSVSFKDNKLNSIKDVVLKDKKLVKVLASYTNNSKRKINTVDADSIKNVIDVLNNENEMKDNIIPTFDKKKERTYC